MAKHEKVEKLKIQTPSSILILYTIMHTTSVVAI